MNRTSLELPGAHNGPDVALWDPQVRSDALSRFAGTQRRIQAPTPAPKAMPIGTTKCVICDNTGYADYAGFAMDVCPCQDPDPVPALVGTDCSALERRVLASAVNPKELAGAKKPASWSVMPRWVALQVGRVMSVGAAKYGAFNYRETPIAASTYQDALERHLALWFDGEDNDAETGVSHLASAIASCTLLMDAQATGQLVDDRQKTGIVRRTLDALEALLVSLPLPAPKPA